jgi:uncharacterized membrane protein
MKTNLKKRLLFVTRAGIIAALYVVFTYIARLAGLDSGMIQLRISEALCILPVLPPPRFRGCSSAVFSLICLRARLSPT